MMSLDCQTQSPLFSSNRHRHQLDKYAILKLQQSVPLQLQTVELKLDGNLKGMYRS